MKSLKRKILTNTCILSMLGCLGFGVSGLDVRFTNATGAELTLASLTVSKLEVRLPDAENQVQEGMRILLSVSAEDYQTLTANENYAIGVLIAPERKVAAEALKFNEDGTLASGIVKYEYDRTYVPKLNAETGNYDFSVVLKDIPTLGYYTDAISAKAYLKKAENTYEYTNVQTNSMTGIVADVYAGLNDGLKEKVESYVVGGFCELTENYTISEGQYTANAYNTLEEIAQANAISLNINNYGALLIGQEEIENVYSSTVKITAYANELTEMFGSASYDSDDEGVSVDENGKITATVRNLGGVDANGNSLKNSVKVSFLGGAIASECEFVVLDETIRDVREFWVPNVNATNHVMIGETTLAKNATTATINAGAKKGVDDLFHSSDLINRRDLRPNSLYAVDETTTTTNAVSNPVAVYQQYVAYGGQGSIKEISYYGDKEVDMLALATNSPYFKLQMQFTQEQVKMMMDLGYDTIKIPAYLEVANDANGLQSQALGYGTRNYVQLISPIYNNTTNLNRRSQASQTRNSLASSLFYVNTWQDILIPLDYVYTNYDLLRFKPSANAETAGKHKALFGFENELSTARANANTGTVDSTKAGTSEVQTTNGKFYKNFYFGNITVYKSDEVAADSLEASAVENVVDLNSMQAAKNFAVSGYAYNNHTPNQFTNSARRLGGLVSGAEINGKKGNFYNFSLFDARYNYASSLNQNNVPSSMETTVYYTIPCSKEYLQSLKDKGFTKLTFEMTYKKLVGLQKDSTDGTKHATDEDGNVLTKQSSTTPTIKSSSGGSTVALSETSWNTISIDLQWLINNYAKINESKSSTNAKQCLFYAIQKPDYPVTYYIGNFQLG